MRVLKVSAPWWVRMLAHIVTRLHAFVLARVKYEDLGEVPLEDLGLPEAIHPMDVPLKPKKDTYH